MEAMNSVEDLLHLSPIQFQEMVMILYKSQGCAVQPVRIPGRHHLYVDITTKDNEKSLAECRIGLQVVDKEEVQSFLSLLKSEKINQGAIITMGDVSEKARREIKKKPIFLYDGNEFLAFWNNLNFTEPAAEGVQPEEKIKKTPLQTRDISQAGTSDINENIQSPIEQPSQKAEKPSGGDQADFLDQVTTDDQTSSRPARSRDDIHRLFESEIGARPFAREAEPPAELTGIYGSESADKIPEAENKAFTERPAAIADQPENQAEFGTTPSQPESAIEEPALPGFPTEEQTISEVPEQIIEQEENKQLPVEKEAPFFILPGKQSQKESGPAYSDNVIDRLFGPQASEKRSQEAEESKPERIPQPPREPDIEDFFANVTQQPVAGGSKSESQPGLSSEDSSNVIHPISEQEPPGNTAAETAGSLRETIEAEETGPKVPEQLSEVPGTVESVTEEFQLPSTEPPEVKAELESEATKNIPEETPSIKKVEVEATFEEPLPPILEELQDSIVDHVEQTPETEVAEVPPPAETQQPEVQDIAEPVARPAPQPAEVQESMPASIEEPLQTEKRMETGQTPETVAEAIKPDISSTELPAPPQVQNFQGSASSTIGLADESAIPEPSSPEEPSPIAPQPPEFEEIATSEVHQTIEAIEPTPLSFVEPSPVEEPPGPPIASETGIERAEETAPSPADAGVLNQESEEEAIAGEMNLNPGNEFVPYDDRPPEARTGGYAPEQNNQESESVPSKNENPPSTPDLETEAEASNAPISKAVEETAQPEEVASQKETSPLTLSETEPLPPPPETLEEAEGGKPPEIPEDVSTEAQTVLIEKQVELPQEPREAEPPVELPEPAIKVLTPTLQTRRTYGGSEPTNPYIRLAIEKLEGESPCIFITGRAGSGKKRLLEHFTKRTKKNAVVLTPTEIGAIDIEGQSIRSFFGFPEGLISENDIQEIADPDRRELFKRVDTIIVNDISRVGAYLMDAMDRFMRINGRETNLPFGGTHVFLFGDLFLSEPGNSEEKNVEPAAENYRSPFFFDAHVFQHLPIEIIELQNDPYHRDLEFLDLLQSIRTNSLDEKQIESLNARVDPGFTPSPDIPVTTLTANEIKVKQINQERLKELPPPECAYIADIEGDFGNEFPTERELILRRGAQVMLLNNDRAKRWAKGTIGKVTSISEFEIKVMIDYEGSPFTVRLERENWQKIRYQLDPSAGTIEKEVIGEFTQYPVCLAWALSVQKSLDCCFDHVIIDFAGEETGFVQMYAALCNCKNLGGVTLKEKMMQNNHPDASKRIIEIARLLGQ
jgi:ATP-dependent DNA helicase PIF1